MIVSTNILILFLIALVICLMGFKKYILFISIGYGFAISGIAAGCLILYRGSYGIWTTLYLVMMLLYGLRLGGFLTYRELKTGYNARMKGEISDGSGMSMVAKIGMWIGVGVLYILMTSPLIYRLENRAGTNGFEIAGFFVSLLGITLESLSDLQKNRAKKANPKRFVDTGLFRIVRCPNYLGELTVWTGVFLAGFGALKGAGQWMIAVSGYLLIVFIMFSGARRLEIRQDKNYGSDPAYKAYKKSTPILLPLVPLYSVKKHKWLVG